MITLAYIALGLAAGLVGSVVGLGGGTMIVPGLTLLFGLPMKTAVASSMVAVVANSLAGSVVHLRTGIANIKLALALGMTTTLGALTGGLIAVQIDPRWQYGLFAVAALYMAYAMKPRASDAAPDDSAASLQSQFYDPALGRSVQYGVRRLPVGMLATTLAGNLAALLGIGGGMVNVPIMSQILGVPIKVAVGTSILMNGLTGATAAIVYYGHNYIVPALAIPVALGAAVGAQFASRLVGLARGSVLRTLFRIFMLFIALEMGIKALT